jgi:tetratricopeptide (TPR) repeat protein
MAETAQSPTSVAFARQDLGALLVKMGRYDEAIPLLETAVSHWQKHGDDLNRLKCEAGLALAQLETGRSAEAAALAESNWEAFRHTPPSGAEPQVWYWGLHQLLARLGRAAEAGQLLEAAYAELQAQAQAIKDDEMRRRFFAQVPDNRTIVAAYDQHKNIERTITVSLVHEDVPLGRPLQPEDKITIQWTINAPEDEAISGKTGLRQHQLCRLLREAEEQHAAPTDDDLAQALGVSRRTILRDMESLKAAGITLPTRRRS